MASKMVQTIDKKCSLSSSQMYLNCLILPPAPFREMGRKSDLCSTVHGRSCDNFGATGRVSVDGCTIHYYSARLV